MPYDVSYGNGTIYTYFCFWGQNEGERKERERALSLPRLIFFLARCFSPGELLEEGGTSSTTEVSDDFASVEREERSVRLGASSVIKTSTKDIVVVVAVGERERKRIERQRSDVRARNGKKTFTEKQPFSPISATLRLLESSLLSIRAVFDAFR